MRDYNMPNSIRQMVQDIQNEVAKPDLQPDRAAELLVRLSALTGNISQEVLDKDMAYNQVLLFWLENEAKANRAKVHAECTPEYRAKIEARNTRELATEIIRALKYLLKSKEQEMREARY